MNNSIQEDTTAPEGYSESIKHYVDYAVSDLEDRFRQAGEITGDFGTISRLKLLNPVNISVYSPLTLLLTGDTDGSCPLHENPSVDGTERKE